jgi:hypothetical protein
LTPAHNRFMLDRMRNPRRHLARAAIAGLSVAVFALAFGGVTRAEDITGTSGDQPIESYTGPVVVTPFCVTGKITVGTLAIGWAGDIAIAQAAGWSACGGNLNEQFSWNGSGYQSSSNYLALPGQRVCVSLLATTDLDQQSAGPVCSTDMSPPTGTGPGSNPPPPGGGPGVSGPSVVVSLASNPIISGGAGTISYSATGGPTSCQLSSPIYSSTIPPPAAGQTLTYRLPPQTSTEAWTVTCLNPFGAGSATITQNVQAPSNIPIGPVIDDCHLTLSIHYFGPPSLDRHINAVATVNCTGLPIADINTHVCINRRDSLYRFDFYTVLECSSSDSGQLPTIDNPAILWTTIESYECGRDQRGDAYTTIPWIFDASAQAAIFSPFTTTPVGGAVSTAAVKPAAPPGCG